MTLEQWEALMSERVTGGQIQWFPAHEEPVKMFALTKSGFLLVELKASNLEGLTTAEMAAR